MLRVTPINGSKAEAVLNYPPNIVKSVRDVITLSPYRFYSVDGNTNLYFVIVAPVS